MTESSEKKSVIPIQILKPLEEFSDCFALFYFDLDGNPCYASHMMSHKDRLALTEFMRSFLKGKIRPQDDEEANKTD